MPKKTPPPLYPAQAQRLAALGERLRAARLRRKLSTTLFAERMGASRETLRRLELGDPSIAFSHYFAALHALGLAADIDLLAQDDALGRQLQDAELPLARKPRVPRSPKAVTTSAPAAIPSHPSVAEALAKYKKTKG